MEKFKRESRPSPNYNRYNEGIEHHKIVCINLCMLQGACGCVHIISLKIDVGGTYLQMLTHTFRNRACIWWLLSLSQCLSLSLSLSLSLCLSLCLNHTHTHTHTHKIIILVMFITRIIPISSRLSIAAYTPAFSLPNLRSSTANST